MARDKHTAAVTKAANQPIVTARYKASRGEQLPMPALLPDGTSLDTHVENIVTEVTGPITENITTIEGDIVTLLERNVVQAATIALPPTLDGETTLEGAFGEDAIGAPVLIGAAGFVGVIPRYAAEIID